MVCLSFPAALPPERAAGLGPNTIARFSTVLPQRCGSMTIGKSKRKRARKQCAMLFEMPERG
jgi:hypothetical protein